MSINRRQFMQIMAIASAAGLLPKSIHARAQQSADLYDIPNAGQIRLLHITDSHAQLQPLYFREPHINLGIGTMQGKIPHIVGKALLQQAGIADNTPEAHAFTYLNFSAAAEQYGKIGGFAHLATLIKRLRDGYGKEKTLLLDGGDTWQGSGTAYWTRGQDMVGACNLLGVDIMTGHWEFTYLADEILKNIQRFKGEFIAQNITVREEAYLFEDKPVYDEKTGHAFKPYTIRELNGVRVAIIGQAFPYTPIANPSRFIPDWTFGIQDKAMQTLINEIRAKEKPAVVVVLSHNGMDVDLKMAAQLTGIDVILGGHTHDGVPKPVEVKNNQGMTLVCNAGSNGKFLGVLDFTVSDGKVKDYQYHLLPIFANLLPADKDMQAYIDQVRAPFLNKLTEKLATTDTLLYRRGNFNGTFDQLICNALRQQHDAQIALSPGFRWGTSILPGQAITMENVLDQTCITYPETYRRDMTGTEIKLILEDVCDNLFNADPYLQQGGDMVRVGGLNYVCDPTANMNQRISNMTLDDGTPIDMQKRYPVAGWATVGSQAEGSPIWEIVADYLREQKVIKIETLNTPILRNVDNNLGIAEQPS
ncbi:thiosulfohydrolase SoxB [Beggiatoa leptomitoformis]|uniref:Thiosulfohydrolase SoxB n=2 Tax=Beggiatoa TaxID=1021 RepID=A0A2N9YA85_9GAMM|nr:thiosulfohydrolase SoxB [Beggiatoa leptomitoformis]ALG67220.1 thiosulfohydrolase SoxB [Beggiatoa leptomitoformis]AUI67367.1 thiosulfohydrolase SoxB [Beggiatoa leptomitoformis]